MISRDENNHLYFKKRLEALGFPKVTPTMRDRDGLYSQIKDLNPSVVIIGARFYHCCTPFLLGELKQRFPDKKFVAVSIGEYPLDLAMYFIQNGAESYVSTADGFDRLDVILAGIRRGKDFISPPVQERMDMRDEFPKFTGKLSGRHWEVLRLVCCGFTDGEVGEQLQISKKTVTNHKTVIYTALNVRNPIELIIVALTQKIIPLEELYFHPKDYTLNPLPDYKLKGRRVHDYQN